MISATCISGFALAEATRRCTSCGQEWPESDFRRWGRTWLSSACRYCRAQQARERRQAIGRRPVYRGRLYSNAELWYRDIWTHVVDDLRPSDYAAAFGASRTRSYELYHRAPYSTDEERAVVWEWLRKTTDAEVTPIANPGPEAQEGRLWQAAPDNLATQDYQR
jgi:hypothetical protein